MDLLQPLAAVGFVLSLLGLTLMFLKKRGAASFRLHRLTGAGARRLETLEKLSLGPQHSLYVVRVDDRSVLIGTGGGSVQILCDLREPKISREATT